MTEREERELLHQLHSRMRRGYPAGELREDLLQKGYTAEEADHILDRLNDEEVKKSSWRESSVPYIISIVLVLLGIFSYATGSSIGIWLIISGAIRAIVALVQRGRAEDSQKDW
jgi:hypothetical protein